MCEFSSPFKKKKANCWLVIWTEEFWTSRTNQQQAVFLAFEHPRADSPNEANISRDWSQPPPSPTHQTSFFLFFSFYWRISPRGVIVWPSDSGAGSNRRNGGTRWKTDTGDKEAGGRGVTNCEGTELSVERWRIWILRQYLCYFLFLSYVIPSGFFGFFWVVFIFVFLSSFILSFCRFVSSSLSLLAGRNTFCFCAFLRISQRIMEHAGEQDVSGT